MGKWNITVLRGWWKKFLELLDQILVYVRSFLWGILSTRRFKQIIHIVFKRIFFCYLHVRFFHNFEQIGSQFLFWLLLPTCWVKVRNHNILIFLLFFLFFCFTEFKLPFNRTKSSPGGKGRVLKLFISIFILIFKPAIDEINISWLFSRLFLPIRETMIFNVIFFQAESLFSSTIIFINFALVWDINTVRMTDKFILLDSVHFWIRLFPKKFIKVLSFSSVGRCIWIILTFVLLRSTTLVEKYLIVKLTCSSGSKSANFISFQTDWTITRETGGQDTVNLLLQKLFFRILYWIELTYLAKESSNFPSLLLNVW